MDLDWDLLRKPEDPKPAWDGVWDEVEEMEKFSASLAEQEHEYQARSEIEKQDLWFWGILSGWNLNRSIGAGILLYFHADLSELDCCYICIPSHEAQEA